MKVWVCRTGKKGEYEDDFLKYSEMYLARNHINIDISKCNKNDLLSILRNDDASIAQQTISNIWSQIDIFVNRMEIGDFVVIPRKSSRIINFARIEGAYVFDIKKPFPYNHSRKIQILKTDINIKDFPQDIQYSLDAFRTIFQLRQGNQLLELLEISGDD